MIEYPGDELSASPTARNGPLGRGRRFRRPTGSHHAGWMRPRCRLIRPRLRGERGHEPDARGDAADRLADEGSGCLRRQEQGQAAPTALLAVPELGVVLGQRDPLGVEAATNASTTSAPRSSRSSRSTGSCRSGRPAILQPAIENSFSTAQRNSIAPLGQPAIVGRGTNVDTPRTAPGRAHMVDHTSPPTEARKGTR